MTNKNWFKMLLTVSFIILCVLNFIRIDSLSHSASDTLRPFFIQTVILILLLIAVYYLTGKKKNIISKK